MIKIISFSIFLVMGSVLFCGCGLDNDGDRGKAPTINAVYFYEDSATIPTSTFNVGDTIRFVAHFEDPDADIVTLHVVIYDLGNPDTIYDGPTVYDLDSGQWSENTTSQKLDAALQKGEYRVDFQAADEKNNISLIFRKRMYVL
jgi:hypothetical protein